MTASNAERLKNLPKLIIEFGGTKFFVCSVFFVVDEMIVE